MIHCPACDRPVDPLRSRFVGVRDGKIVAYCSAECAAGEQPAEPIVSAGPAAVAGRAVPPATGAPIPIPTPRAEVSARIPSPATGAPPRPPTPSAPATGVPDGIAERGQAPPIGAGDHAGSAGAGGVTQASGARAEPVARHPDDLPIAAFRAAGEDRSGVVGSAGEVRSAPVAAAPDRQAEAARKAGGAGSARAGSARVSSEASSEASSEIDLVPAPRRSRLPILLVILALLGVGSFLVYRFVMASGLAAATRPPPAPAGSAGLAVRAAPPRAVRAAEPPAVVDVAAAVERARATLARDLAATSPRVQRLAAAALARTQDAAACALLAAQIGARGARDRAPRRGRGAGAQADGLRTSEIARLDLAYALARGGDRRGSEVLAGALRSPRAEVRDEAARLLALLGDRRAVPHLVNVLAVSRRRLGAAEHLAHLGEPGALKILDRVRADPRASAADKARATVALGIAGRGDVAAALRDMLGDPHFNAFAAAALAELKDPSARPVLERQLASPPLRVLAARALRRLDPAIDPRPLLPPLLDVLRSGRDVDRIPAAEAILLLAGPARWADHD